MKKIILLFLLIIVSNNLRSQTVFPLHVGDRWVYLEIPNVYMERQTISYETKSNEKGYYEICCSPPGTFYRQEGDSVFIFDDYLNDEYLVFDFTAEVGDTITNIQLNNDTIIIITLESIGEVEFFGLTLRRWYFFFDIIGPTDASASYGVTDSLGITNIHSVWNYFTLHGAVIDNKVYGNINDLNEFETEPHSFSLFQNHPNPYNSSTIISYQIPVVLDVIIKVFDGLGKEVAVIVDEKKPAGYHKVEFDGSELTSGTYFYRIQAGDFVDVKKMVLMK